MNALVSYRSLETITPDIGPVSIGGSWDILVDGDRSQTSTLIVERASASPICTAAGNGESCIPEYGDITTRSFTQYYLDNTTVAFRGCGEVSMCTSSWSIIPSLPADTVPLALDDFGPSWLPLPGSAIRTIGLATNVEMVHDAASSTALIHLRGTISPAEVITDALTPRFGQALAAAVVTPAEEEFYSANPAQLDVWVDGETSLTVALELSGEEVLSGPDLIAGRLMPQGATVPVKVRVDFSDFDATTFDSPK